MSVREAIASIYADQTLDEAQQRAAVYRFKAGLLLDVIRESDLLNRAYTHAGASYLIKEVMAGPQDQLIFGVEVNGARHTIHIINPPLIPREPTGDERADMRQAVVEMLEGFGV